jgi:WD40 repeat protein
VTFSPGGSTLASGSGDKTIRLWDVRTHKPRGAPLSGHTSLVSGVAFSRDGRTLASTSFDKTIRLWDVGTHKQRGASLTGHTGTVYSVTFSPGGSTLASGSGDKTIRLWDVRTHKQRGAAPAGHTREIDIHWRTLPELQTEVCNLVGSGLSKTEWVKYASGISYRQSCP